MNRSAIREVAFQFLYGAEIQKELQIEQIDSFLEANDIHDEKAHDYIVTTVNGIKSHEEDITKIIENNLKADWQIERISKVSLALLKLAIFEIRYQNLPYKAIINEVVELAKKYGEDTSKQFVNGILASVVKEYEETSENEG